MYDMYHWDTSVPATEDTGDAGPARGRASRRPMAEENPRRTASSIMWS